MQVRAACLAALLALALAGRADQTERARQRPFLGINEDNDRYFLSAAKDPAALTEEGVRAYFDSVAAGGAVTHFFMCVNGQRTSYDSKVWEPIWLGLNDRNEHGKTNDPWCVNAKTLNDRGIDPWKIWCARAREKGVSPWISMRMNDGHYAERDYKVHRNESFWWTRRDLWRKPTGPYMCDRVFDYSKPEVREHALALVREIASRWDLDGLELDWLRQVHCLSPGRGVAQSQSGILTDFLRDCRRATEAAADRLGHPVGLSVRVPTRIEGVREWGFDVETWAREGLVDLVVVCDVYCAADYDMDLAGWKRTIAAANPRVRVVPGTDACVSSGAARMFQLDSDFALLRGWAATVAAASGGECYVFNAPYFKPEAREAIYRGDLSPERIFRARRRFPVTFHEGMPRQELSGAQLPLPLDGSHAVRVNAYRGENDASAEVVLRMDNHEGDLPEVFLNGLKGAGAPVRVDATTVTPGAPPSAVAARWRFSVDSVRQGANEVRVVGKTASESKVTWVEIVLDVSCGG